MNDVFILYSESDQGARRNMNDVMRAGQTICSDQLKEVPHAQLALYGAAILMTDMDGGRPCFQSRKATSQARVRAVAARQAEAMFLDEFAGAFLLKRIPIRMAMVATFRADAGRARLFWTGVGEPERLPIADPRHLLHNQLLGKDCRRGTAAAIHKTYSVCVNHWNAHVGGSSVEEYSSVKTPAVKKPTVPVPTLATARLPLRPAIPTAQTFTGAMPAVTPMSSVPAAAQ